MSELLKFSDNDKQLAKSLFTSAFWIKNLPGGHSAVEPPDPMPNSEVKRGSADGSVAFAMRE